MPPDIESVCLAHSGVMESLKEIQNTMKGFNRRLSTLEKFMYVALGAILMLAVMVGSTPLVNLIKAAGL